MLIRIYLVYFGIKYPNVIYLCFLFSFSTMIIDDFCKGLYVLEILIQQQNMS